MKPDTQQKQDINKQGAEKPLMVDTTMSSQPTASVLPNGQSVYLPEPFGAYRSGVSTFPNDGVQLDIYNDQDYYYESIVNATQYSFEGNNVLIDLEQELINAGYESGDFRVRTRLLRNFLGGAATTKLLVQEISPDRLELRVIPAQLAGDGTPEGDAVAEDVNIAFARFFGDTFFTLDKQVVLSNLYVFIDNITSIEVTDYIQDKFTVQSYPYSIILKLQQALPITTNVGSLIWVSQEANPPVTENVVVYPKLKGQQFTKIKGPNFDVLRKKTLSTTTEYQNWDEILSANTRELTRTVLSQSLVEGTELNVDYTRFENFVKFGSVYERIKNFEYKVKLIENYQNVSASLATSTASGSFYVQTQMSSTLNKIDNILGAFDGFEKYMYFQSSSYVSNSFGEFLDTAWPKSNTTKPYILYGSSTTQVENWLEGILSSASLYDNNNSYSLRKLVPQHIQEEESQVVDSFVSMLGHFFDIQYEYINQIPKTYDRQEDLTEGFAKELVYHVARNLGVDFSNGSNFTDLWSYTLGLDASGSYDNVLKLSGEDRTRETWKRVINNLPYLLKTKGTERGIRALINCYGIPSTVLRIREYGGPEVDFDRQSTYDHDRFYYALGIGSGSSYGQVKWIGQSVSNGPSALELRFKADNLVSSASNPYRIAHLNYTAGATSYPQIIQINTGRDSVGDYVQLFLSASNASTKAYLSSSLSTKLFDGNWVNVLVEYQGISDFLTSTTGSYNLFIGQKANYSKTPIIASASISWQTSSQDYINTDKYGFYGAKVLEFGTGSTYSGNITASFSGSLQEIRLWGSISAGAYNSAIGLCVTGGINLEQSPFYAHTISPTTIVSPNYEDRSWTGSTGSFADLYFRLTLGTDNRKIDLSATSSLSGSQPNYNYTYRTASFVNFSSNTSSYWAPIVETNYMPWPDIAGNRQISNKVRLDQTIQTSRELYRNQSVQISLQDEQPIDSPRLGIYLSPVDEINKDIAEQFAGLSLDDYIGSYDEVYSNYYEDLAEIRQEYLKKNLIPHKTQNYIRLLQHFNGSLFSVIKQMVPYRANLQTGLVLEPHVLDRSKVKTVSRPAAEDEYYETLIDMPSVEDPTGDVSNLSGSIDTPETEPIGVYYFIPTGSIGGSRMVTISGKQNEYNNTQVPMQGRRLNRLNTTHSYEDVIFSGSFTLEDVIPLNVTSYGRDKIEGSQYIFPSWYRTGSIAYSGITTNVAGFAYLNSVGDDYSDAQGLYAINGRASEVFSPTEMPYNVYDFFNRTGSFDKDPDTTVYTGNYFGTALGKFGFRFIATSSGAYWAQSNNKLLANIPSATIGTASFTVPCFYTQSYPNTLYNVSFNIVYSSGVTPGNPSMLIAFGSNASAYTYTLPITSTQTTYNYISKADGPYLYVQVQSSQSFAMGPVSLLIDNLVVTPYIKTAVQDYQVGPLASIGQRNQKYDGCKLIATDFNVNSADTIDGGPVVEIITGPGSNIAVSPSTNVPSPQRSGYTTVSNPGTTPTRTVLSR